MLNKEMENSVEEHEPRQASYVFVLFVGTLIILAAFQSASLVSLSYDLPQGVGAEQAVAVAETWHGWMQATGVAGITENISAWIEAAHELKISN